MKANDMNPDQTLKQSDLGLYCLPYRLPKQMSDRMTQVMTAWE